MLYRLLLASLLLPAVAQAQPVTIARIEQMGGVPADYFVRDWTRVAQRYDSLAFDLGLQGTHLPLVRLYGTDAAGGFGLHTYVGTNAPQAGEAINALPALVGATLVGIDKRTQFGVDWVQRAQDYFNAQPGEGVYLNTPVARSGSDGWYDTMPNVFFYQLYDLYGSVGAFDAQFTSVADRWRMALDTLGGSVAPWRSAFLNYRAFALSTMEPLRSGVQEPEMAGALAWLQYMAYVKTGDERYRISAEWAMEFLSAWQSNPSYELQLPYGALAAARMNAELGTAYDVEKMVNWSFEMGPLRGWGTVVGAWGDYSASGLVGEIRYDGYAFALNGYQQAAALVPLVRYDDRFARAIGRWMLHLTSASRLFYHPFLPDAHQDSEAWAQANDPEAAIAYEGLRRRENNTQPFATGDALRGGWAATNLSLYTSSSTGYLAALVDTTDVRGILRLDLNATDFFAPESYASYLYYNPHASAQTVSLALPTGTFDLYDAAGDAYLARGVQGVAAIALPADAARVVVVVPSGGVEALERGQRRVNGVVVDYRVGTPPRAPRIKAFAPSAVRVGRDALVRFYCAGDGDGGLAYAWTSDGGTFGTGGTLGGSRVQPWSASEAGTYAVACAVTDGAGQTVRDTLTVEVLANLPPAVTRATASPDIVDVDETTALTCAAADPDGDALTYTWRAEAGTLSGEGAAVTWTAPSAEGAYTLTCRARDPAGNADSAQVSVTVGHLVAHLLLEGDGRDRSAFGHDGTVVGAAPAVGPGESPGSALRFDGVDDHVAMPATEALNMREALTVSITARPAEALGREQFLVSHGSWQNKWKLSVTPEDRVRWTVNTGAGIVDLDAPAPLPLDRFTRIAATFDGQTMALYLDAQKVAEKAHTGTMARVDFDLLLGQMLPGQADFNFKGVLYDFQLYNRAFGEDEIPRLYGVIDAAEDIARPGVSALGAPYPNPSSEGVTVPVSLPLSAHATVTVYDVLGREVRVLVDAVTPAGLHQVVWDGRASDGTAVGSGVYVVQLRTGSAQQRRVIVRVQ